MDDLRKSVVPIIESVYESFTAFEKIVADYFINYAQIDDANVDGRWIFEQAIEYENPIAIKEIDFMISGIMHLVSNYVALINPEVVIFGGGIMEQVDYLKPRMIKKFQEINANQLVVDNTKIEFASLGNRAGMLGAYAHFKNKADIN